MTTFVQSTRERAVLSAIVREADTIIGRRGSAYLGRTAMQKIPYFLKVCGVPLRYRFDVYHYGTFCQPILGDMEALEIGGVVCDQSNSPDRYSNYAPGQILGSFLDEHQSEIEPHVARIRTVVDALYPWDPARLELISTLHYVSRQLAAMGQIPGREDVIARFQEFKGDKFSRAAIDETLSAMADAGLVCLSD